MSANEDKRLWPMMEEAIRHRIATAWAIAFTENILPLLSAFDERERISIITREAEIFLKTYCGHLEQIAKRSQELAQDAINCSLRPVIITKEQAHERE